MHSFVSKLRVESIELNCDLVVTTSSGVSMWASFVLKSCEVCLENEKLHPNLIILDLFDFDVILSIDWLPRYRAMVSEPAFSPSERGK